MKASVLATIAVCALSVLKVSAQSNTLETVQQFVVGPQPDAWSFDFQVSRFLPTTNTDQLVKVELILAVHSDYPQFTATASEDSSVANWDVTETVTVKNLRFTADDGCDDDQDKNAVKELEIGTELVGSSNPLPSGGSQVVPGGGIDAVQPTVTLTSPDDLARFTGDPSSPKSINIKIANKQSRSFMFKPGKGTFTPARKDYHPQTSATLTINYYTSTTANAVTCESGYDTNAAYLILPAAGKYSCSTH